MAIRGLMMQDNDRATKRCLSELHDLLSSSATPLPLELLVIPDVFTRWLSRRWNSARRWSR